MHDVETYLRSGRRRVHGWLHPYSAQAHRGPRRGTAETRDRRRASAKSACIWASCSFACTCRAPPGRRPSPSTSSAISTSTWTGPAPATGSASCKRWSAGPAASTISPSSKNHRWKSIPRNFWRASALAGSSRSTVATPRNARRPTCGWSSASCAPKASPFSTTASTRPGRASYRGWSAISATRRARYGPSPSRRTSSIWREWITISFTGLR